MGKLLGPLHGLSVSIKDTYHVKGTQATISVVAFLNRTSKENSALAEIQLGPRRGPPRQDQCVADVDGMFVVQIFVQERPLTA